MGVVVFRSWDRKLLLVGQGLRSWGSILYRIVLLVVEVARNRIVGVERFVVLEFSFGRSRLLQISKR
jgi:hypothetical protein